MSNKHHKNAVQELADLKTLQDNKIAAEEKRAELVEKNNILHIQSESENERKKPQTTSEFEKPHQAFNTPQFNNTNARQPRNEEVKPSETQSLHSQEQNTASQPAALDIEGYFNTMFQLQCQLTTLALESWLGVFKSMYSFGNIGREANSDNNNKY